MARPARPPPMIAKRRAVLSLDIVMRLIFTKGYSPERDNVEFPFACGLGWVGVADNDPSNPHFVVMHEDERISNSKLKVLGNFLIGRYLHQYMVQR